MANRMNTRRCGFSLMELLVVVAVIVGLMGVGFPVYFAVVKRLPAQRTHGLVQAVAAAIATYPASTVSVPGGGIRRLWDFNGDGELDGDPALTFAEPFKSEAAAAGYRGFVAMTGVALEKRMVDPTTLRVLDGWKRPLRISFAVGADDHTYGPAGLGIWSFGASGPSSGNASQPAVASDVISSWKGR